MSNVCRRLLYQFHTAYNRQSKQTSNPNGLLSTEVWKYRNFIIILLFWNANCYRLRYKKTCNRFVITCQRRGVTWLAKRATLDLFSLRYKLPSHKTFWCVGIGHEGAIWCRLTRKRRIHVQHEQIVEWTTVCRRIVDLCFKKWPGRFHERVCWFRCECIQI